MKIIEVMIDASGLECLMCHLYRWPDEVQTHWCSAYGVKLKTTDTGAVLRCGKCLRNEVGGTANQNEALAHEIGVLREELERWRDGELTTGQPAPEPTDLRECNQREDCDMFVSGPTGLPGGDCGGDGHYMCRECVSWSGKLEET